MPKFGLSPFDDSNLHDEQERELHPENEYEQQVEPPPSTRPLSTLWTLIFGKLVLIGEITSSNDSTRAFRVFDLICA